MPLMHLKMMLLNLIKVLIKLVVVMGEHKQS